MQIADKYSPQEIESKWYDYWIEKRLFHSEPDQREPYTIVIPPPNVTGMLHMGHMLNNTLQDVLVRRARMSGKNACWVPGMDHASIATEAKVVAMLHEKGIEKSSLSREKFLEYAWEWKEKYGGMILKQLRKLGASCDWERTCFTMDEPRTESVIKVFCDLFEKGRIYRGVRMVNWDPAAKTALSDEEVVFKESHGKLYYLRYKIEGTDKAIIVATTRPETILGDTALCVNPNDPRYEWLAEGARVIVPLVGRSIPVIRDEYVDIEFGTGALKVTPAHDVNDYMLGEKYGLETIDIFNDDGTINDKVGLYVGQDRFDVRRQIEKDLDAAVLLEKTEEYTNNVGYSERTGVAIEPKLSMQWFLSMQELAVPATKAVMEDAIRFVPEVTEEEPADPEYETLSRGSVGDAVEALQRRLNELGYNCGSVDGVFGSRTRRAVRYFQDAIGYNQTGVATPSLQRRLFASDAPEYQTYVTLNRGDTGIRVENLQSRLRELGYLADPVDGDFTSPVPAGRGPDR